MRDINKDLDNVFKPLGDLVAPKKELLDGTLGNRILSEALGKPANTKKRKRNAKGKRNSSNM